MFLVLIKDIDYALSIQPAANQSTFLPPKFQDFANVFSLKEAKKLPMY